MIPKRPIRQEENVDAWLMSYADMITLLLCFFIIFVSVSEPKKDKISEIAEGMSGKFGAVTYDTPFSSAARTLKEQVEAKELNRDVAVEGTSKNLSVELATAHFFTSGSAEINAETLPILQDLVSVLKDEKLAAYQISIESHTDDTPPQSGLYKNNWELSALRAAKLAEYCFGQGIEPRRLRAVGLGDAYPKVPNLDAKGAPIEANRAANQRVVLRVE